MMMKKQEISEINMMLSWDMKRGMGRIRVISTSKIKKISATK